MTDSTPVPAAAPGDDDNAEAVPAPDEGPSGSKAPTGDDAPTGGDELTEDNLQADNAVEEDMLRALDPGAPSA